MRGTKKKISGPFEAQARKLRIIQMPQQNNLMSVERTKGFKQCIILTSMGESRIGYDGKDTVKIKGNEKRDTIHPFNITAFV